MRKLLQRRFDWLARLLGGERGEHGQDAAFAVEEVAWLEAEVAKLRAKVPHAFPSPHRGRSETAIAVDDLRRRVEAYDVGDRSQSPPVALLRELFEGEAALARERTAGFRFDPDGECESDVYRKLAPLVERLERVVADLERRANAYRT